MKLRTVLAAAATLFQLSGTGTQTYSFHGANSGETCTGRVYLPAGYDPTSSTRYTIIVVLHGKGGSSSTSAAAFIPAFEAAIAAGQMRKAIVVMPDYDQWGTNTFDGSGKQQTKLIEDVIPYFLKHTRCNGTLLGSGFSMGCWTITALAMRFLGLFLAIWGVAGPNMDANPTSGTVNNWRYTNSVFASAGDTSDLNAIWGPTSTAPEQAATLALLEPASPCASKNSNGLANAHTAGIIANLPSFYCDSAGDGVSLASMQKMDADYSALAIPHVLADLGTPGHSMLDYYAAAQAAASMAAGNGFIWMELVLAGGDARPPLITSAAVSADGLTITGTLSKSCASNSPTGAQFVLSGTLATVASASVSGTSFTLTLATTGLIRAGATIALTINSANAAVKIQSAAGVPLSPVSSFAVTNNSTQTPLTIITSVPFLWWNRADLGVTQSSGAVSAWADQSSGGHGYSQGTAAARPAFSSTSGPNSGPGVTWDGTDDTLSSTTIDLPDPSVTPTYFLLIAKQNAWTSLRRLFSAPSGGLQLSQSGAATPDLQMRNTTAVNANSAGVIGNWVRIAVKFTGSTADSLKVGATTVTGASAGTTNPASGAFSWGSAGAGNFASFTACEFMALGGVPTGTELTNIDKYFFGLYGATVAL